LKRIYLQIKNTDPTRYDFEGRVLYRPNMLFFDQASKFKTELSEQFDINEIFLDFFNIHYVTNLYAHTPLNQYSSPEVQQKNYLIEQRIQLSPKSDGAIPKNLPFRMIRYLLIDDLNDFRKHDNYSKYKQFINSENLWNLEYYLTKQQPDNP